MFDIGIVGCGLQAATIAGYLGIYGDDYRVVAVMDANHEFARSKIAQKEVALSESCRFYDALDDFLDNEKSLHGVIIGTPCHLHTDVACALEPLGVPIYLEKPVSITLAQLAKLRETFQNSRVPVQVSLPMRLCPVTREVKGIIDSGEIGAVEQIVAYNDVSYGDAYFSKWYRDFDKTGGMFMQKAVHDIDYLFHLGGSEAKTICAMRARRVFGGDKSVDLTCDQCDDQESCTESPYHCFHARNQFDSILTARERRRPLCRFSRAVTIDDIGECIIECESGAHLTYAQNFFVRGGAHRRGARLYGYKGTIEMNFKGEITIFSHLEGKTKTIQVQQGPLSHYGGDKELVHDYLQTMRTGKRSRTDLIHGAGLASAHACLLARESADRQEFMKL